MTDTWTNRTPPTFMSLCRRGIMAVSDVDLWVEFWHITSGRPMGEDIDLADYLGLTDHEYGRWLREGDAVLAEFIEMED